ncbi:MAG TPA: adenylate kinase [Nitrolancea sp.]|nr:adenylate kinase [Nitrolancea sp.]
MAKSGAAHVIIMGPQGAGKGTQAALIAPRLRLEHVSTGDLFRQVMAGGSELSNEVRSYVDRGALVPDELTIRMLMEHVDQVLGGDTPVRGMLLDGFPRNQAQAEALDRALAERGDRLVAVVHIDVPRERLMERLTGRLVCPNCGATYHRTFNPPKVEGICDVCGSKLIQRSDDTPEAVERRLSIYYEQTAPVLDYYRAAGLLIDVDGDRPIGEVAEGIVAAVLPKFAVD